MGQIIDMTKSRIFDHSDPENFSYSAALVAFVLTRKKDIKGGTMFQMMRLLLKGQKRLLRLNLKRQFMLNKR